jgi:predicted amidohydrolase YtcJ
MTAPRRPLLLLLNGSFHTLDSQRPRAAAVAVDRTSGRVVAVGDDAEIRPLTGPLTDTLDLRGRTVLPGFIDSHTHLLALARDRTEVDLGGTRSEADAVERVRRRAEQTPPGHWIHGRHWDKSLWSGNAFPTRASLDAAVPGHSVALRSYDGHSLWVNSSALRGAGIGRETPDPVGGTIVRDGTGEPTGMLFEFGATSLVESTFEAPSEEADLAMLRSVLADLRARGITGVHNIEPTGSFRLMQRLRDQGELRPRVLFYLPRQSLPDASHLGLQAGFGDDALRFGGIKVFADGALTSQTAAMLEPFEGQPNNRGLLTTSDAEVEALATAAASGGMGVAIHAIGDRAVHAALDGIERTLQRRQDAAEQTRRPADAPTRGTPVRFRLEHVQLATPEDIRRMARLGVVASVQPFHAVADRDKAERYWGARSRRAYAYRALRDAGIPLALGSDVPVDTFDPLRILHAAVTRRDDHAPDRPSWQPEQALTLTEALYAYTLGAAYAGGQEAHQGSIAPGKLADFVVLEEDLLALPVERIAQTPVVATIVGGELVYGTLE